MGAPFSELGNAAEAVLQNEDLKFNPSPADALLAAIRSIRVWVSASDHHTCALLVQDGNEAFALPLVGDREAPGDILMRGSAVA